jgi:hypothetical protein
VSPFVRERTLRDLVDDLEAVVRFLSVAQRVTVESGLLRAEHFDVAAEAVNRAIDTLEEMRLRTP